MSKETWWATRERSTGQRAIFDCGVAPEADGDGNFITPDNYGMLLWDETAAKEPGGMMELCPADLKPGECRQITVELPDVVEADAGQ